MAIEQITERIVADARRQADEIVALAETSAKELIVEKERLAKELSEVDLARGRTGIETQARQLVTSARLEARDRVLRVKQAAIDEAFRTALDRLEALDEKTTLAVLTKQLLDVVEGGEEVVLSPRDHQRLGGQLIDTVNRELAAGKRPPVKLALEPGNLTAGFILRTDRIEENHSFDGLVASLREEMEAEIAALLWG